MANSGNFSVGAGVNGTTGTLIINTGAVVNIGAGIGYVAVGGSNTGGNNNYGSGTLTINGGTLNVAAGGNGSNGIDDTNFWLNPYGGNANGATIN